MCKGLAVVGWFKREGGEWFASLYTSIELLKAGDQLGMLAFEHLDVAARR